MFCIKLIALYLIIYGILFITGWGVCIRICKGESERYRHLLAPIIGILPLSILPIYFSILGINTYISGIVIFILFSSFSLYSLIRTPPTLKKINLTDMILFLIVILPIIPSFSIILRAGYLTSTLQSYSAFVTITADYFMHNSFAQNVTVDFNRPVTNMIAEVINNHEYYGFFFIVATIASLISIPPYKLYLVLSAVIGSLLPISVFITTKVGFHINDRLALFISFLISINFSYFVWPLWGQLPIVAGIIYLILVTGFIPSMIQCQKGYDYIFYSVLIAGILSMYWILISYALGILVLYALHYMRFSHNKSLALKNIFRLGLTTFIINPYAFIFLILHGMQVTVITSQFTKNIPRYPYLEELLGFAQHFTIVYNGSFQNYSLLVIALFALFFVCAGVYERYKNKDGLFVSTFVFIFLLSCFFYLTDMTYHFYKSAVIGVFILGSSLVIGMSWIYHKVYLRFLKLIVIAVIFIFIILNINTLIRYSLAEHRVINNSLINLEQLSRIVPTDEWIWVNSYNPTEEAWISYYLRRNKIKLNGYLEPWGFWVLSPFSGKPNPKFFYNPDKDNIYYTLSSKPPSMDDIVKTNYGEIVYENDDFILSRGIPSPYLFKGWHNIEQNSNFTYRWTMQESSVLFARPYRDSSLQIKGIIPPYYTKPLEVLVYINGSIIDIINNQE